MREVKDYHVSRAAPERDWTKGNIFRNLLSLSWPMVIMDSFWVLGMTVDMIWVGKLGAASLAGIGVAGIVLMLLMGARWGLNAATGALVARFIGAGDAKGASHVAQQSFVISGIYAIVATVIGIFLAEPILILFGLEANVVAEGAAYMRLQLVGLAAMSFWMMGEGIMRASGDAMNPMKITIIARSVHLILDPFLIFGWGIFPRLGVTGAAAANLIAYSLGMVLTLWLLFSGRTRLRLTLRNFRLDPSILWRIVKIGIPASVMGMERTMGRLVIMLIMVPFGTLAVAAHTLAQRIEMVLYTPGAGLGAAAGVLMGQNLGARQPERAERSGWLAVSLVEGLMVVCSLVILLGAESIIRLFSPEPALIKIASTFIRIEAVGYLVMGFVAVLQMSLSGAGDTLPPMLIGILMMWGVQLPLAYFLPQVDNLGMYGVRWALVAGAMVSTAAYILYFRLGWWKRKKI